MIDTSLDRDDHDWLEKSGRINLQLNGAKLSKLKELAVRLGLDGSDARTGKVVWSLVDNAHAILREKEKAKDKIREEMEALGIRKGEL